MPLSLLSPLPLLHSFSPTKSSASRIRATPSRLRLSVVKATSEKGSSRNVPEDDPSFNPFGFVTDNPSSRSAIQLPESPAEDGNVGQMLYVSSQTYRKLNTLRREFAFKLSMCWLCFRGQKIREESLVPQSNQGSLDGLWEKLVS